MARGNEPRIWAPSSTAAGGWWVNGPALGFSSLIYSLSAPSSQEEGR